MAKKLEIFTARLEFQAFIFIKFLNSKLDQVEYLLGNFFDPPKYKLGQNTDLEKWCSKVTAKQAVRTTKYFLNKLRTEYVNVEIFREEDFPKRKRAYYRKVREMTTELLKDYELLHERTLDRLKYES